MTENDTPSWVGEAVSDREHLRATKRGVNSDAECLTCGRRVTLIRQGPRRGAEAGHARMQARSSRLTSEDGPCPERPKEVKPIVRDERDESVPAGGALIGDTPTRTREGGEI